MSLTSKKNYGTLSREAISRLWRHISLQRRRHLCYLLALTVLASLAEVLTIGAVIPFLAILASPETAFQHPAVQPLIEYLKLTSPEELMLPLTVAFAFAVLFSSSIRWALLWSQMRIGYAIGSELSLDIYRRTIYQPYSVHLSRNSSEIISGIVIKTSVLVNNTILPLLAILSSSIILCFVIIAFLFVSPLLVVGNLLFFGSVYALVVLYTRRKLSLYGERVNENSTRVVKILQEGIGGIRDVLLDGTQEANCEIFRQADIPLRRAQANIQIIGGSPRFAIEALSMIAIAWLAFVLASSDEGASSALPMLGAVAIGAQRLLPIMQQIYLSLSAIRGGQASLGDALDLLEQPIQPDAQDAPIQPMHFQREMSLENISFRYDDDRIAILKDVNIVIPKGSKVGFIGVTGSGKSTLLDIIMGLLQPSCGRVVVDGCEITESNKKSWWARIAHVPQNIFISDATVLENIAFGVPRALIDRERAYAAAQKAQLLETIEAMPEGFETYVGEGGARISGGQRQRIAIARAMYKNADVLVFDEATSALDNGTEKTLIEEINRFNNSVTVLMVAHRLTTLMACDLIVELKDGKISRMGTYSQVVGEN